MAPNNVPSLDNDPQAAAAMAPSDVVNLEAAFLKLDIDGNGTVDKKELWGRRNSMTGQGLTKAEFDVIFDKVDVDKSGDIDFDEYCRFVNQVRNIKARPSRCRSSLKFSTQVDSLRASVTKTSAEAEETSQNEKRRSFVGKGRSSFRALLASTYRQAAFTKSNKLDLNCESEHKVRRNPQRSASVRFFDVEVREYDVTASDNPCVNGGAAIELGWDYSVLDRLHLDTFEDKRSAERSTDFSKEKRLTKLERDEILRQFGATPKEIQQATKRANIIRNQRMKSIATKNKDKEHEAWENRLREIKKRFSFKKKKIVEGNPELDLERLHPTLMVLMGLDETGIRLNRSPGLLRDN